MIFIDASALIAIIADEPHGDELAACLDNDLLQYSAMSAWETMAGLCRSYLYSTAQAKAVVKLYADDFKMQLVGIGAPEYELAAQAHEKFGKGRHQAALNMGDCFAYACTKVNRAKLLFLGNEFGHTDIASARV